MKSEIKDKLNLINDLFPDERVQKSKERWRCLWNSEPYLDRIPFVYINVTFDQYDTCETPELILQKSLDEIILRGHLDDDYVPGLFPGCRMSTAPSIYGASEVTVGNDYSCEKILRDPQDILRLPDPEIRQGSVMDYFLQVQKYCLEETDGRLPVHVVRSEWKSFTLAFCMASSRSTRVPSILASLSAFLNRHVSPIRLALYISAASGKT